MRQTNPGMIDSCACEIVVDIIKINDEWLS